MREHSQADKHPLGQDQADFLRLVTFPEEDRHLYTSTPWSGGFRWFRSPNVIPIERAAHGRCTDVGGMADR